MIDQKPFIHGDHAFSLSREMAIQNPLTTTITMFAISSLNPSCTLYVLLLLLLGAAVYFLMVMLPTASCHCCLKRHDYFSIMQGQYDRDLHAPT